MLRWGDSFFGGGEWNINEILLTRLLHQCVGPGGVWKKWGASLKLCESSFPETNHNGFLHLSNGLFGSLTVCYTVPGVFLIVQSYKRCKNKIIDVICIFSKISLKMQNIYIELKYISWSCMEIHYHEKENFPPMPPFLTRPNSGDHYGTMMVRITSQCLLGSMDVFRNIQNLLKPQSVWEMFCVCFLIGCFCAVLSAFFRIGSKQTPFQ